MHIHYDWNGLPASARGASVAMGNFDGIHRGHHAVIKAAREVPGAPLGIITFEPHPRQFFQPDAPPFRLMNAESRANRLARLGVDHLYQLPFGPVMAGLSPDRFVEEVLVDGLGISHVTVGQDFCFGKGRAGNAAMLERLGALHGFGTTILPIVGGDAGRVSSTAIRAALSRGQTREAQAMLGHWHRIDGPVQHGDKRGHELGFPTANMSLEGLHPPRFGVYAVLCDILTGPHAGESHRGAASVGVRPTFGVNKPNLETFLLDFEGDLYGQHLSVALIEYLRPEIAFSDIPALVAQMGEDVARARSILSACDA